MAQLEYGDYYKFIASAGIALIASAVVVPWMFLREPFDLAVEASKIPMLTPDSQYIIHTRQHVIALIMSALPRVSFGLGATGSLLTGYGLIGWHSRQSVRDKSEDLATRKLEEELKAMSPAQIEDKAKSEVESAENSDDEPIATIFASAAPSLVSTALAVEQAVQERFRSALGSSGVVLSNQRLGRVEFDAIVKVRSTPPLIVELKYIRKGFNRSWFVNTVRSLTVQMAIYSKTFSENASGLVLIVIATNNSPLAGKVMEMERELQVTQPLLLNDVRVRTIYETQIATISNADLKHLLLGSNG